MRYRVSVLIEDQRIIFNESAGHFPKNHMRNLTREGVQIPFFSLMWFLIKTFKFFGEGVIFSC